MLYQRIKEGMKNHPHPQVNAVFLCGDSSGVLDGTFFIVQDCEEHLALVSKSIFHSIFLLAIKISTTPCLLWGCYSLRLKIIDLMGPKTAMQA